MGSGVFLTEISNVNDVLFDDVGGIEMGFYPDYPIVNMGLMRLRPNAEKELSANPSDIVSYQPEMAL